VVAKLTEGRRPVGAPGRRVTVVLGGENVSDGIEPAGYLDELKLDPAYSRFSFADMPYYLCDGRGLYWAGHW
jgi:hypothetical protein